VSDETMALADAEALLRLRGSGMLATISRRVAGWPFGSVVPYAIDREGRPIILIAGIAEHTKNIQADPRVSVLVQEAEDGEDVQAKGRLTVMGRAEPIPENDIADAQPRYLAKLPSAEEYFDTHDFAFYRISVEHLRYIGGFGEIFWLDPDEYRARIERDPIVLAAKGIIDHMNEDHEDAMALWCRAFRGLEPKRVRMIGVDRWGTDLELEQPDLRVRFDFAEPASPDSIRRIVVAMTAEARAAPAKAGEG
jgi:putative heme iron utilization protein